MSDHVPLQCCNFDTKGRPELLQVCNCKVPQEPDRGGKGIQDFQMHQEPQSTQGFQQGVT